MPFIWFWSIWKETNLFFYFSFFIFCIIFYLWFVLPIVIRDRWSYQFLCLNGDMGRRTCILVFTMFINLKFYIIILSFQKLSAEVCQVVQNKIEMPSARSGWSLSHNWKILGNVSGSIWLYCQFTLNSV